MKVFKFGGASVSNEDRIRNTASIIGRHGHDELLIVISAMGKTTNALEDVVDAFYNGNKETALARFGDIKNDHVAILSTLTGEPTTASAKHLNSFFTEIEWLLHDKPVHSYDYYYDQIVCVGELLSTSIVSHYLTTAGIQHRWMDVRDLLRTDDNFRDARIDWSATAAKTNEILRPALAAHRVVITQGFIGATDENESTTLGREGSDYTAAVFANILDAESVSIWKDVKGVMNADPKQYDGAEWIRELNYREVIEMAYYGAQVIHPKTIKPLQNKSIPLYVRSFLQPDAEGTCIKSQSITGLPPIIVYKHNQVLVQLYSRDFSFASEQMTSHMIGIFNTVRLKPNLTQNAAISLMYVVDDKEEKLQALCQSAAENYDVHLEKGLTLLTIRHYEDSLVEKLVGNAQVVLTQKTPETVQVLMKK